MRLFFLFLLDRNYRSIPNHYVIRSIAIHSIITEGASICIFVISESSALGRS